MQTIRRTLTDISFVYPLENEAPLSDILFIDIETTGFTAKSASLYLIGCAYYENELWHSIQWFADGPAQEAALIEAFFEFAAPYTHLIHFNGNQFDLPFISQKCSQLSLSYDFSAFTGIDLYKRIFPFRHFLKLPNCKQKTLERFLGIFREDPYDGGQLISIYRDYLQSPTATALDAILKHNEEDLIGMFHVLPVLAFGDIFSDRTKVKKVQANYYHALDGSRHQELYMKLSLPAALPKEVSYHANGCYFIGEGKTGAIKVPLYEEELKYFYANYRDYYYLPLEDTAIHKSIASFVDKTHRVQAKAQTCYTRKRSSYLPEWEPLFEPFFRRDYKSQELFFEITDEFKKDRRAFQRYALHVLKMLSEN